jgi:hypothetical protein
VSDRARHCGGFRLVRGNPPRIEDVHGRACRSADGLCACPCKRCAAARQCKHEHTYLSAGFIQPLGVRMEFGRGRAKRADGTDYVGPVMTMRALGPGESALEPKSWRAEICMDCGMKVTWNRRSGSG